MIGFGRYHISLVLGAGGGASYSPKTFSSNLTLGQQLFFASLWLHLMKSRIKKCECNGSLKVPTFTPGLWRDNFGDTYSTSAEDFCFMNTDLYLDIPRNSGEKGLALTVWNWTIQIAFLFYIFYARYQNIMDNTESGYYYC